MFVKIDDNDNILYKVAKLPKSIKHGGCGTCGNFNALEPSLTDAELHMWGYLRADEVNNVPPLAYQTQSDVMVVNGDRATITYSNDDKTLVDYKAERELEVDSLLLVELQKFTWTTTDTEANFISARDTFYYGKYEHALTIKADINSKATLANVEGVDITLGW